MGFTIENIKFLMDMNEKIMPSRMLLTGWHNFTNSTKTGDVLIPRSSNGGNRQYDSRNAGSLARLLAGQDFLDSFFHFFIDPDR